jgi:lipoprotein signal peptidase
MQSTFNSHLKRWIALGIVVFIIDLLAKSSVYTVLNPGVSFGIGANLPNFVWLLIYLLITIMGIYLVRRGQVSGRILLILILLSSSNILDRLIWGGVRDYIVSFGLYFNLTDIAINVFVIWVIITTIRIK